MARLLVTNARVLVPVAADPSKDLNHGALVAEDHRIVWTGPSAEAVSWGPFDRVLDASGCVVLPGLVNTHHHLYQTLTRNLATADGLGLFDWLQTLYPIWARLTPEAAQVSARLGLAELALVGLPRWPTTSTFSRTVPSSTTPSSRPRRRESGSIRPGVP